MQRDGEKVSWLRRVTVASLLVVTTGCANLNTIERTSSLPREDGRGVAIHLDAQQRLVLYSAERYCAEPSPDALQAYASALGLAKSLPSQDASSLAAGQQSYAASIGLRTQSITIMRDALYRMCEAYHNGILGDVMVATLLGRSQDLTAVILAVEQLTGAVAANQVILGSTTSASASANLVANEHALVTAQKALSEREAAVEAATSQRDKASMALSTARTTVEAANTALNAARAETPTNASKIAAAESQLVRAQEGSQRAEEHLKLAESDLKTKIDQRDNAKQVVDTIKAAMDAALTDASVSTASSGQFSLVQPRKQLSDNATKEIATAVQNMVSRVLDKSYTVQSCMALLTRKSSPTEGADRLKSVEDLCVKLVQVGIEAEITAISNYAPTNESQCIRNAMENNEELRGRIATWLKNMQKLRISVGYFLDSSDYVVMRKQVVDHFEIMCGDGGNG